MVKTDSWFINQGDAVYFHRLKLSVPKELFAVCMDTLSKSQSLCLDKEIHQIKINLGVYVSFHMRPI